MRPFHTPVIELDDLVGEPSDRAVVGRHHEGHAHGHQCANAVHHEPPRLAVELGRRLVCDDDRGSRRDRLGERRSLLLPARQLVGKVIDPVRDAEPIEDPHGASADRSARRESEVLADREVR
jgi:hypothetical protein